MTKYLPFIVILAISLATQNGGAADWSHGVNQFLIQHGYKLPPASEERNLRALEIGVGDRPLSRDQYNLDDSNLDFRLPNRLVEDAQRVSLPANSLDVIFARHVPELREPRAFLVEGDRLLRAGGVFFFLYDVRGDLDSLDSQLIQHDKSTAAAYTMGYDLIHVRPGELILPNAPSVYGFAFVKPLNEEEARKKIKNPLWRLPNLIEEWMRKHPSCDWFLGAKEPNNKI